MVRIEDDKTTGNEELKKNIARQVEVNLTRKKRRKKIQRIASCFVLVIVFLFIVFSFFAWLMSETGLYDVPFITEITFQPPEPLHPVEDPGSFEEVAIVENLRTKINNLIETEYPGQLTVSGAEIGIPEEILTVFLREQIKVPAEKYNFVVKRAQVAVEPKGMEFFIHLERTGLRDVYLSIIINPRVKDESITFDIMSARLGNLNIPSFVATPIINTFLGPAIQALEIPLVGFVFIQEIGLGDREVILKGDVEYTTF